MSCRTLRREMEAVHWLASARRVTAPTRGMEGVLPVNFEGAYGTLPSGGTDRPGRSSLRICVNRYVHAGRASTGRPYETTGRASTGRPYALRE